MREMLVIVPSRGRPENIKRFNDALKQTNAVVDFKVGVDEDDPTLDAYKKLAEKEGFDLVIGPREKFAKTVNRIVMENLKYKYFFWAGDDHVPRTDKWDLAYRKKLKEMKVGVVYGNDLYQGVHIATELAFTSNIPKTLGYAIPPGFIHLYVDNYFMELGKSIGKLEYMSDVVVEHLHPHAGKADHDQTYLEANSPENWSNDRIVFDNYILNDLPNDKAKLEELLK